MLDLFRKKNFTLLWWGQLCSQFGDRLIQMILVGLVAAHASGSSLTLAKVLAFTSLPALIVSPIAGAYVDRWNRKRTMISCDIIRAGLILLLPFLAAAPNPLFLYMNVFALFAVASFFVPARLAIIPDLVEQSQLAKANAVFTTSGMVGGALTLLVGALLVEWFGTAKACWANSAAYAASALLILPIRSSPGLRAAPAEAPLKIIEEVWEGIRQLWQHENTRRIVGLLALLTAGGASAMVVGTILVQRCLGTVTKDLGFLSLWLGVGMFLGTVIYGRWGDRFTRRAILGFAFVGAGLALASFIGAIALLRSGSAASVAALGMGICVGPAGVLTNTLVHEAHPERMHGRIFSSLGIVVNVAFISSMLSAGWLAERLGDVRMLSGVAAVFAFCGLALIYYKERSEK